jgi:outer membrane protein OmpA-like peptidoglycan-associated protein
MQKLILGAALLCALIACGGSHASTSTSTAEASPAAVAVESTASPGDDATSPSDDAPSPSDEASAPVVTDEPSTAAVVPSAPASAATSVAVPAPTQNSNLLSFARGAVLRRWSVGASVNDGPGGLLAGGPWGLSPAFAGPAQMVFELPAIADITQIEMALNDAADPSASVGVAVATNDAQAFTDAGTLALTGSTDGKATLAGPFRARWIRFTFNRKPGAGLYVDSIAALGTIVIPPSSLAGRWALADSPTGVGDRIFTGTSGALAPDDRVVLHENEIATFETAGAFSGGACWKNQNVWRGTSANGSAQLSDGGALQVVANGSLLVGMAGGVPVVARHIARAASCDVAAVGSGSEIVVIKRIPAINGSEMNPKLVGDHRFRTVFLPGFQATELANASQAILAYDCAANDDLTPDQNTALLDFVSSGHVLVIRDADDCTSSDYRFIPYPFTTSASGANGQKGGTLVLADSSALGSNDPHDSARYVDTQAYLKNPSQQLGDTDIMQTNDTHWCGLMFAKNLKGTPGWVHAYARYGKGAFIYNGFDVDDLDAHIPQAETIAHLDYAYSPLTPLPCSAQVALNPAGPPHAAAQPKRSLATQLEHGGRARIYGIHFDVASARIQPQSEATIREIAEVLRTHPSWRMRVEGHTDSDGAAAENLALSLERARSVVGELAKRYKIASARLVAAGYGQTRPVASNASATGKALNRRVELVRL